MRMRGTLAVRATALRTSLREIWSADDYMVVAARALQNLIPCDISVLHDVRQNGSTGRIGHTMTRSGSDWTAIPNYEQLGSVVICSRRPDDLANKAVNTAVLERRNRESVARAREQHWVHMGVCYQARMAIYRHGGFVALLALLRGRAGGEFTGEETQALDAVRDDLLDGLLAALAIGHAPVGATELSQLLDAFAEPAYLLNERGCVVHRNRAAALADGAVPEWLSPCVSARNEDRPFHLGHAHAFTLDGRRLHVVLGRRRAPARPDPLAGLMLPPSLVPIARGLLDGERDKEIAARTGRSIATVRTYVKRLYERLGIHSRAELARLVLVG